MSIAVWSTRFVTGIDRIDQQHQSLFQAVNDLAESFRHGRAGAQAKACLAFLVTYTQDHFETEEQYMAEAGYADLPTHREEHRRLMGQVLDLQARLEAGETVTMEVAVFLADWLKTHIEDMDMGYVRFVRDHSEQ